MIMNRMHLEDLKRRYRETDWVSEYQRLWAIFNHWLEKHTEGLITGKIDDRKCIDMIKSEPKLERWAQGVIDRCAYNPQGRIKEGYLGSYRRFAADNEISCFFRAAQESTILEPRINWPWRKKIKPKARTTNAITLSEAQFRTAYEKYREILASESGIIEDYTLHQILIALGIGATGCCFYRLPDTAKATDPAHELARMSRDAFCNEDSLKSLTKLADSTELTPFAHDIVETLYNLRNVAVHGSLDFLDERDNAAARAGCDLLDSLIRNIRDHW